MKRFKKLTIYILVGVLVSSTVMTNYKEGEVVKASATLTLGTGALLTLAILAAYGIVYTGAINSDTGEYFWQGDRGAYPSEIEDAEEFMSRMYNNALQNWCTQNGYDPNDDWNGDENKPSTWEKMVEYFDQHPTAKLTFIGTSFMGILATMFADKIFGFPTDEHMSGYSLNSGSRVEYGLQAEQGNSIYYRYLDLVVKTNDVKGCFCVIDGSIKFFMVSPNRIYTNYGAMHVTSSYGSSWRNAFEKYGFTDSNPNYGGDSYDYVTINGNKYYYVEFGIANADSTITDDYNYDGVAFYANDYAEAVDIMINGDMSWNVNEILNPYSVAIGTDLDVDSDGLIRPIPPNVYLPSNESVSQLLNNLATHAGQAEQTQEDVDEFINGLQFPQTNPSPNPNPNPNPDEGGDSGEDSGEQDNSNLLADLKGVFPFCIPFDLIDCFRIFNAEPVTPRVEIPLHFGIVEKDYTFVIDLEDFNGVAQVCRTMFLILFIVGLVLSTRSLIRG